MAKPDDVPQWAWDEAVRIEIRLPSHIKGYIGDYTNLVVVQPIARALIDAERRGMEESQRLRQIVSECAAGAGAYISPDASLDFMALLPKEIAAIRAKADEVQP